MPISRGVDLQPDNGARQLPALREESFEASFEVGMRTPGPVCGSTRRGRREHQRPFQVVVVGEVNSLSDAPRRRQGGGGRRVPVQGVLLLIALLPRRRQDDEDREQLLCVVGATRLALPNPVSHPPPEPRSIFNEKEVVEGSARGRVNVELSGGDAGGTANREGHPWPFLRKNPETVEVREGPQDDGRTDDRTRAAQWRVRERRSRLAH